MSSPVVVPTPITPAQFRTDFPEFSNTTDFTDSQINFWVNVAGLMMDPNRWQRLLGPGTELFVAHNLYFEAMNKRSANTGGVPGINKGVVSSEGAGSINVSYDTTAGLDKDASHWNQTNYGIRFHYLLRLIGAGPIHFGTGAPTGNATGVVSIGVPFISGF